MLHIRNLVDSETLAIVLVDNKILLFSLGSADKPRYVGLPLDR